MARKGSRTQFNEWGGREMGISKTMSQEIMKKLLKRKLTVQSFARRTK